MTVVDMNLSGPVSLDLGSTSDAPLAIGWHTCQIERCEARTSKKGLPQFFVLARITDEDDAEFNQSIIWNLTFDNVAQSFNSKRVKRCLTALGMPEQLSYTSWEDFAEALIGLNVDAYVTHQDRDGEPQANVNKWRAVQLLGDISL